MAKKKATKSVKKSVKVTVENSNNNKEKDSIINAYVVIAQKYTPLDISIPIKPKRVICNNCPNKKLFDIVDNSIYICLICGAQQEILLHTSSYTDIDRINISAKYTYDRKVHFRDCINQYQGLVTPYVSILIYQIFPLYLIFF